MQRVPAPDPFPPHSFPLSTQVAAPRADPHDECTPLDATSVCVSRRASVSSPQKVAVALFDARVVWLPRCSRWLPVVCRSLTCGTRLILPPCSYVILRHVYYVRRRSGEDMESAFYGCNNTVVSCTSRLTRKRLRTPDFHAQNRYLSPLGYIVVIVCEYAGTSTVYNTPHLPHSLSRS